MYVIHVDVRREEKMKPSLRKCLICVPSALTVRQRLPVALPTQASLEKTERKKWKNKAQEHCPLLFALTIPATVVQEAL